MHAGGYELTRFSRKDECKGFQIGSICRANRDRRSNNPEDSRRQAGFVAVGANDGQDRGAPI
jgi:hypothetical protein